MQIARYLSDSLLRGEIITRARKLFGPSPGVAIRRRFRVLFGFLFCSTGILLALAALSKTAADQMANPVLKTGKVRHEATALTPGTWTATGSMSIGRSGFFTATLLTNGQVLVAGGYGISSAVLSTAELYDSSTGGLLAVGATGLVVWRKRRPRSAT